MTKNHRLLPNVLLIPAIGLLGACQALKAPLMPGTDMPAATTTSQAMTGNPLSGQARPAPALLVQPVALEDIDPETTGLPDIESQTSDSDIIALALEAFGQRIGDQLASASLLVDEEIRREAEQALASQADSGAPLDAWGRLQSGMRMQEVMNQRVRAQLDWYPRHPGYLTRTMERARPFLPFILDVLEEKDLPTEFALLPIVESAYQTFAYSHGRASGMWQIIPSTGRFLGLKQNWWYDGRRDIIESTRAATRYLQQLGQQFDGDWELALAAYNAGPGKIRSAIRYNRKKGKPTDFWNLTRIRRETRDYVPKLLALKALFAEPETYQLELVPIDNEPTYEIVEIDSQLDLALAADLAGISTDELYNLNPAFNRWATAPEGPHRLLVPRDKAEQFKTGLEQLPEQERIKWVRHRIREGETLSHIALKYRTTTQMIRKINEIRGSNIRAGHHLLIPTAARANASYSQSQSQRISKIKNTPRQGDKITHTVRSGESFWLIARRHGVGTRELAKWNGMAPTDTLRVGQQLVIWKQDASNDSARVVKVSLNPADPRKRLHALRYTVRKGDSLSLIADRFNVRVADIKKWNRIGKYLQPGQKLKLLVDITRQSG